ncbi:replication factor A protein 3 [Aspergillus ambiguus]|uniref:putative ssDNA binding protein Ssb3 n=1 Tax=Aspergillus ambiguus TaxID=176160 RepID=UPI003CCCE9D7
MSLQTPRVLPADLPSFHPSTANGARSTNTVRLLGTVTALRGDRATLACGTNGDVALVLQPSSHLQLGQLVEVVGKVTDLEGEQGIGVRVLASFDWGNPSDCDYKIYEQVVNATHKFKSLFYDTD